MNSAYQTVETVARASYGRLLAYLASRTGDLAGAEDALSDAFYKALKLWPERGIPAKPEAWLLQTATNHTIDEARKRKVHTLAMPALWESAAGSAQMAIQQDVFPDDRLKMLFVCAHPAIDAAVRTPLLLQTVLGFDASQIASAFLVAPTTMGQRLVRAKKKIRDAGIAYAVPESEELPSRLEAVLEAIYAVYGVGWENMSSSAQSEQSFVAEALYLARLVVCLLAEEPEAQGLLALMLYCEARRSARRTTAGAFVPLSEQDTAQWSRPHLEEAERLLMQAARHGKLGRFQLEAAIQSAHILRGVHGVSNWEAVAHLYEGLIRIAPTHGAFIGHAIAMAESQSPEAGLLLLDALPFDAIKSHQPFWAARAHLLQTLNQVSEARYAFDVAIGLTDDKAVRQYLLGQRSQLRS
jgi:RNA polymerase sigma-70 factor (ECF subfamily)